MQLLATVAAIRAKDIAGQTLGVHAHEGIPFRFDIAHDQCHVALTVEFIFKGEGLEDTEDSGKMGVCHLLDERFLLESEADQIFNRGYFEAMSAAKLLELGASCHGPI